MFPTLQLKSFLLKIIAVSYLCIVFSGCTPSSSKTEGIHPDFDRLPQDSVLNYSVDITKRDNAQLPHFFHPDSLKPIATIGNDSTLVNEFHKPPPSIDVDPTGQIYIVQVQTNSIRVYDKKGNFIYEIGQEGRGPGEFMQIDTFVFNRDYTKLYVLDVFEIEIFTLNNERFEYDTTVSHHFMRVYDMCLLGDKLFMSGYKIDESDNEEIVSPPITKIALENFEHIHSFGYEYSSYSGRGTYNGILSETVLSCNEYSNTIVGHLKRYPYAFGYDTMGRQRWVSKIDGYMSTKSEEIRTSEGTVAFYPFMNNDMHNWKLPIQKIDKKEYSLLQFLYAPLTEFYATSDSRQIKNPIRTILVNTDTGKLYYSDAYKYIGVWKNGLLITMEINPENLQKTFHIHELK